MEVNFSTLHLHLRTPTLSCLCRLSVVFCPRAKCCPRMFTNHTNSVRIREIRVNSRAVTSVRAHLALGHLGGRGRGGAVSCLDGRWGGFRVARRARSWPAARGAVGFRGRGRRPPGGRGSGASRRHETALCAVHESPRARDTKKRQGRSSRHENASPCSRRKGASRKEQVVGTISFSVLFCGARSARVFFVAKANEEADASGDVVGTGSSGL